MRLKNIFSIYKDIKVVFEENIMYVEDLRPLFSHDLNKLIELLKVMTLL